MSQTLDISTRLRLLVIEDDADVALIVSKTLERAGHTVRHCLTAAEARDTLAAQPFDLILLDHHLPDMGGLDLLRMLIRERVSTPALMVTAFGNEQLAAEVLRVGALDYVVKDAGLHFLADLPKRVSEAVSRHRLAQNNRLLLSALESAQDGILITDLHGTILHVNHALERMTGYAREELLGQHPRLWQSEAHPPEFFRHVCDRLRSSHAWQGELTIRRRDGSALEVWLAISPIRDAQGQPTHFVGIQRDISERRQMQRQLIQAQKMQGLGTLAGGIAHEFNNLLTGITGYAALGQREVGQHTLLGEYLEQILHLSERAAHLTRQLLTFARTPAVSRRPMVLEDLLRATADLVTRSLQLEVQLELQRAPDSRPLMVAADGSQLQQALINLSLNARDALVEPAPIRFVLRPASLTAAWPAFPETVPPGDYALVEVVDDGCGMPPEVLNQVLDPFYTTKGVGKGTGLGLPVVLGIVHAHLGYLTIDTTPGQGTRVGLYLPRLRQ
jgi:PAS domain S-box-containing protein